MCCLYKRIPHAHGDTFYMTEITLVLRCKPLAKGRRFPVLKDIYNRIPVLIQDHYPYSWRLWYAILSIPILPWSALLSLWKPPRDGSLHGFRLPDPNSTKNSSLLLIEGHLWATKGQPPRTQEWNGNSSLSRLPVPVSLHALHREPAGSVLRWRSCDYMNPHGSTCVCGDHAVSSFCRKRDTQRALLLSNLTMTVISRFLLSRRMDSTTQGYSTPNSFS